MLKHGFLACIVMCLQGCAQQGYSVLALTTTIIGVEVSQNPANQTPQAKLGYNRSELAFVPTNRNAGEQAGNAGDGAKDSANVLMELRYGGIFDTGPTSGIYQRLAVGETAVKQPGASTMFTKNAAGEVSPPATDALREVLSAQQLREAEKNAQAKASSDNAKIALVLAKVAPDGKNVDKAVLKAALDQAAGTPPTGIPVNVANALQQYKTAEELKEGLEVLHNRSLLPLFKTLYP